MAAAEAELVVDPQAVAQVLREGAKPVSDLAGMLPPERGKRTNPQTLVRWITRGKKGVRLEGYRGHGNGWFSSVDALSRFFARLSGNVILSASDAERERRAAAAMAELQAARPTTRRR